MVNERKTSGASRNKTDGITVRVLGDYGPFSRMGKSIGYQVTIGQSSFLVDCGSPLFQQIGGETLNTIKGLMVTHCHDDHKRWFSDLALFNMYARDTPSKIFLLTTEGIKDELFKASGPALDRSLSADSKQVVDIAYEDYFAFKPIGPLALYRIASRDDGKGMQSLYVSDREGRPIEPDRAKIVVSGKSGRPRMLFKDPHYKEWVEPESFYSFSSEVFYEGNRNIFSDPEGFTIEAINAPVWHGISGIGLKFKTEKENLLFTSDTAHDLDLWKQLYSEKRTQRLPMPKKEFENAAVIRGDINDYIERMWSEERFIEAVNSFKNTIVIHDIESRNSVVHTDYWKLMNTSLTKDRVILTHSPDTMTSEWVLSEAGKSYKIQGHSFFEIVGDELYRLNADIYHKETGKYYVGYRNQEGKYAVCNKNGVLNISADEGPELGALLYRVDLYEDISGRYLPKLEEKNVKYIERDDSRIELVEITGEGSRGRIVENQRANLAKNERRSVKSGG